MKRITRVTTRAVTVVLAVSTAGLWASAAEDEGKVSLDDLPAIVRAAVEKHVGDGRIIEIEREREGVQMVYEVEYERSGREYEIEFSPSGELVREEEERKTKRNRYRPWTALTGAGCASDWCN